jgi:hypothetical protein
MVWPPADNSIALRHIVLTLLALAVLAERAALCPLPVRLYLFEILRRAEYAATALLVDTADLFTADMVRNAPLPDDVDACRCSLIRQAFSLRVMAMMIAAGCKSIVRAVPSFKASARNVTRPRSWPCALPAHGAHDTS